ncbi:MAG: TraR/DksA family transcriptional regulator [Sneathiellales bacterium]|nr:TraR/DksA family transcriptional regulator [Sneathiellales bacterium]
MLELAAIKEELVSRHKLLEDRVAEMENTLRQEHSSNFSEQAMEREDEEVMERLEKEALDELGAIEAALGRLKAGTYGICTVCGDDIGEKRLKILPYASRCINCAK